MTPLTVSEARAILIAHEALDLSYAAREESGQTFGIEELDAWVNLVKSANDRIVGWGRTPSVVAVEAAAVKSPTSTDTEAQALRTGIETIMKAFGTNSAEWTQQFRALLDRVPATTRST